MTTSGDPGIAPAPVLRIVRPTRDPDRLLAFWRDGLGLGEVERFRSEAGFEGVLLARAGWPWHVAVVRPPDDHELARPSANDTLVLYMPDPAVHAAAVARMEAAGFRAVAPANPYWAVAGRTYEDPDGFRIVLQMSASPV